MQTYDLNAPVRPMWWPTNPKHVRWKETCSYPSLREAVTVAITDASADQEPCIMTDTGLLKGPDVEWLWREMNTAWDMPDTEGTKLRDDEAARKQAVVFAGEVLRDHAETSGKKPTGVCG